LEHVQKLIAQAGGYYGRISYFRSLLQSPAIVLL
jgi:hypothetical protein